MKNLASVTLFVLAVAGTASADPPAAPPAVPARPAAASGKTYGQAGCGLGAMLLGSKPGFTQVFAATTNGTSASQTFGISSGTSNCDGTGEGAASAKNYIETNREALAKDIARGNGEAVAGLATIAGCADSRAVGAALQRNFKKIFTSAAASSDQVSASVLGVLSTDASLACSAIQG